MGEEISPAVEAAWRILARIITIEGQTIKPDIDGQPKTFIFDKNKPGPPSQFAPELYADFFTFITALEEQPKEKQKEYFFILRSLLNLLEHIPETENFDFKALSERIKNILETTELLQAELFPFFPLANRQKTVELRKEFALNFGGLDRIEKEYKHLLTEKLTSGLTLQQHINKVRDWFNSLQGEDLGNWIKLFAFAKEVKDYSDTNTDIVEFQETSPGRYRFRTKQNKVFFSYFIRPDKNTGQFTTKAKNKFLKWLYNNQRSIEFPMIINGKVWNVPIRIYEYAEGISDKEIFFIIDTNILESEFKDYVSINIGEIDAIEEAWENIAKSDPRFSRSGYSLNNFVDIPLKFLLTLKNIYSRGGDYKTRTFAGNVQTLSGEALNSHLGDLSERLKKHLAGRNRIKTGKTGKLLGDVENLILETTFKIAKGRGWLLSMPGYENGIYKFNINAGYFDRKNTARRLKACKNP